MKFLLMRLAARSRGGQHALQDYRITGLQLGLQNYSLDYRITAWITELQLGLQNHFKIVPTMILLVIKIFYELLVIVMA
jgi:hypothetical protein